MFLIVITQLKCIRLGNTACICKNIFTALRFKDALQHFVEIFVIYKTYYAISVFIYSASKKMYYKSNYLLLKRIYLYCKRINKLSYSIVKYILN